MTNIFKKLFGKKEEPVVEPDYKEVKLNGDSILFFKNGKVSVSPSREHAEIILDALNEEIYSSVIIYYDSVDDYKNNVNPHYDFIW